MTNVGIRSTTPNEMKHEKSLAESTAELHPVQFVLRYLILIKQANKTQMICVIKRLFNEQQYCQK